MNLRYHLTSGNMLFITSLICSFFWSDIVRAQDLDCKVKAGRYEYDLTALGEIGQFEVTAPSSETGKWFYGASFCRDLEYCKTQSGNFKRYNTIIPPTCEEYGKWANGVSVKTSDGFQTTFTGIQCTEAMVNYTGIFKYVCDPTATDVNNLDLTAEATGTGICEYTVTIPTDLACGGGSPAAGGLSGGSILLILLVCVIFVYIVGMMSFSYYKEKSIKAPHTSFWCNKLPYWTKTGCLVSWAASLTCYRWCCKKIFKAKQGDDAMEDTLIKDDESS